MKNMSVLAAAACGLLTSPFAAAATFTLTTTDVGIADDGECSLIEAIDNANANSNTNNPTADPFFGQTRSHDDCPAGDAGQEDVIELAAGNYTLTGPDNFWFGPNGLPPISSEILIIGAAAGSVIERDPTAEKFRLFFISGGQFPAPPNGLTDLPAGSLTLENLTLQNGLALGGDGGDGIGGGGGGAGLGGAVFNIGVFNVSGVSFVANTAQGGAGGDAINSSSVGGGGGGLGGSGGNASFGVPGGGGFGGRGGDGVNGGTGSGGGGFRAQDVGAAGTFTDAGMGGGPNGGAAAADGGYGGGGGGTSGLTNENGGRGGFGAGGGGAAGGGAGAGGLGDIGGGGGGSSTLTGGNGGFGGGAGAPGNGALSPSSSFFGGGDGGGAQPVSFQRGGFGGGGNGAEGSGGGGAGLGGAVFNIDTGRFTAINSTFSGNFAIGGLAGAEPFFPGQPGSSFGGAVFNAGGDVVLTGVTMANNTAEAGGGLYVLAGFDPGTSTIIQGSVLADSLNASSDCTNIGGSVTSSDATLIESNDGCGNPSLSVDPNLAGLANNGGPTQTHNPASCQAPVVGAGNPALCADPLGMNNLDQRGNTRPATSSCDIGSVELQSTPSFTSTAVTSATENVTYQYDVTGSDSTPGCTFTFAATTLPSWLTFTDNNNGTATLSGTPGDNDPGDHNVVLQITSSIGTQVSQSFTIVVVSANEPPAFVAPSILDATVGQTFSSQVQATDSNTNDTLTIEALDAPTWLTVTDNGNRSASLTGTPAEADFGLRPVQFRVEDQEGASSTTPVFIRVSDGTDNTARVTPTSAGEVEGAAGQTVAASEFVVQNRGTSDHQISAVTISVTNPDTIGSLTLNYTGGSVTVEPVLAQNEVVFSPPLDVAAVESLNFSVEAQIAGEAPQVAGVAWGQTAIASVARGPSLASMAPAAALLGLIGLMAISRRSRVWAGGAMLFTLLTACGGGGQSSPSPTPVVEVASEITLRAITAQNASNAAVQFQGLPAQLALVKKR